MAWKGKTDRSDRIKVNFFGEESGTLQRGDVPHAGRVGNTGLDVSALVKLSKVILYCYFPSDIFDEHLDHFSVEPLLAKRKGGRDGMYWPRLLLWYPGTVALREQAMAHQSLVALSLPAKQLLLSYFQPFLSVNLDSRSQFPIRILG